MRILLVGGTFDNEGGRMSGIVNKMYGILSTMPGIELVMFNGNYYSKLESILDEVKNYDVVFWMANVPNDYPKIREVKVVAPHVLLVSSKRNDNGKYSFLELVNHALCLKANLTIEFIKHDDIYYLRAFDPLGTLWYEGMNLISLLHKIIDRLNFLLLITRQPTIRTADDKDIIMNWYFDRYKKQEYKSEENVNVLYQEEFISLVKSYAERFHEIMTPAKNVSRFLGNASFRPDCTLTNFRCTKGFPSFRSDKYIFVSQRNVNKAFISAENFVPTYLLNEKVYYCGDTKPSVDTPIQLRLYDKLLNINYMIHSHCYIKGAPYTSTAIPCGAMEEVNEILQVIDNIYKSRHEDFYIVNLIGHGSICMGANIQLISEIKYKGRNMPETIIPNDLDFSDVQTDSDMEDLADKLGISTEILCDEFYELKAKGTPCEGCKNYVFYPSLLPCNNCSRISKDWYQKK